MTVGGSTSTVKLKIKTPSSKRIRALEGWPKPISVSPIEPKVKKPYSLSPTMLSSASGCSSPSLSTPSPSVSSPCTAQAE